MKAKIEYELIPFDVPDYVVAKSNPKPREEGFKEVNNIFLSALDSLTLDQLCYEFKVGVFRKAGKEMLPIVG